VNTVSAGSGVDDRAVVWVAGAGDPVDAGSLQLASITATIKLDVTDILFMAASVRSRTVLV
jgi:hypothetical protein